MVRSVSQAGAVLEWSGATEGAAAWQVESQGLTIGGTDSRLQVQWLPLNNVQFSSDTGGVSAHLAGLQPNVLYVLRMTALDAQGRPLAVSGQASFITRVPPASRGKIWLGLLAAALAVAFYFWHRRRRL